MAGKNREKQQAKKEAKRELNGRKVNPKHEHERNLPPVIAKGPKQKKYFALLANPEIQIIIVEGLFGTGKTFCSSVAAADAFRKNEITQIIVARAYVQTGKTSGFRPGTAFDKLYPYVRNVLDTLSDRMGKGAYTQALGNGSDGQIQVQAIEDIRGRSFDEKSYLMIEEAQQTNPDEMLSIVTRIGEGCKLIISGDDSQRDTHGQSGLAWFKAFAKRHNLPNVGYVNFNEPDDIVRSGIVRAIALGLVADRKTGEGEVNAS